MKTQLFVQALKLNIFTNTQHFLINEKKTLIAISSNIKISLSFTFTYLLIINVQDMPAAKRIAQQIKYMNKKLLLILKDAKQY